MIIKPPPKLIGISDLTKYLTVTLWSWFRDLSTALNNLNFLENFSSFIVKDLTIPAGTEVSIVNSSGYIPSYRIIVKESVASTR